MALIRPAENQDKESVRALARGFGDSFREDSFEDSWNELVGSEEMCLLVAEDGGEVRGYLLGYVQPTFFATGPVGYIEQVIVDEATRRKGLGGELVSRFEDWARQAGCRLVALASRHAGEFYKSLGYEKSATYFRKRLVE